MSGTVRSFERARQGLVRFEVDPLGLKTRQLSIPKTRAKCEECQPGSAPVLLYDSIDGDGQSLAPHACSEPRES